MNKNYFRIRKNLEFYLYKYRLYLYSDDYTTPQYIGWDDNSDSGCFKLSENVTTVYLWDTYSELYRGIFNEYYNTHNI